MYAGRNQTVVFDCVCSLEYFSVQFYGECWSGTDSGKTFARDGPSEDCYEGVGEKKANAVYRLEDLPGKEEQISRRIIPKTIQGACQPRINS